MPSLSPIDHARRNLHAAKASLVTARARLADAEHRFEEAHDCSLAFIASGPLPPAIAWWHAELSKAERNVADAEAALQLAMASA